MTYHRLLTILMVCATTMLLTFPTMAGSTIIRDSVGLLNDGDRAQLIATGGQWSFDTTVLIENVEKSVLNAHASTSVSTPNMVVIALSPAKHTTTVRFGSGAHVDQAHWETISKAGNGAFKEERWRAGIETIGFRANVAVEETRKSVAPTASTSSSALPRHEQNAVTATWISIGLAVVFFACLAWWMIRRHRRQTDELKEASDKLSIEAADIASKSIVIEERREKTLWEGVERGVNRQMAARPSRTTSSDSRPQDHAPSAPRTPSAPRVPSSYVPTPAPTYTNQTTVIHERGGASDFAVGMLVGDALSDRQVDHHHHYEPTPSRHVDPPSPPSSRRNHDSGGSSSFWNSTSESSSSFDSGGSSSSWDSSSSSSFDSGGSSSDW